MTSVSEKQTFYLHFSTHLQAHSNKQLRGERCSKPVLGSSLHVLLFIVGYFFNIFILLFFFYSLALSMCLPASHFLDSVIILLFELSVQFTRVRVFFYRLRNKYNVFRENKHQNILVSYKIRDIYKQKASASYGEGGGRG